MTLTHIQVKIFLARSSVEPHALRMRGFIVNERNASGECHISNMFIWDLAVPIPSSYRDTGTNPLPAMLKIVHLGPHCRASPNRFKFVHYGADNVGRLATVIQLKHPLVCTVCGHLKYSTLKSSLHKTEINSVQSINNVFTLTILVKIA